MSVIDLAVFAVIAGLLLDAINSQGYEVLSPTTTTVTSLPTNSTLVQQNFVESSVTVSSLPVSSLPTSQTRTRSPSTSSSHPEPTPPPIITEASVGDVKLDGGGTVKIYYTDGSRNASWDRICTDYGSPSAIGSVICRQLGFQDASKTTTIDLKVDEAFGSDAIIHGFDCGENPTYNHILQCSLIAHTCINHALSVICNGQRLSDNPFDGQVRLCPPKQFPSGNQSVSTGLVLINLHKEWRGINQPKNSAYPLGSREADSICRQLGYTGAIVNSARPWSATLEDYSTCYSESHVVPAAWFMTNDSGLNCSSKPQDCIGCCFHYPSTHCTTCSNTTDIVLTCTYDLTILRGKGVTGWNSRSTTCSFSDKSLPHSTCAQQLQECHADISLRTFKIIVGSVGSVALVLFFALTVSMVVILKKLCYPWLARRHQQDGDQHLMQDVQDEN